MECECEPILEFLALSTAGREISSLPYLVSYLISYLIVDRVPFREILLTWASAPNHASPSVSYAPRHESAYIPCSPRALRPMVVPTPVRIPSGAGAVETSLCTPFLCL